MVLVHDLPPSPCDKANFLSKVTFCWLTPLFFRGYKRDLTINDLQGPLSSDTSAQLGKRLADAWEKEVEKYGKIEKTESSKMDKKSKKKEKGPKLLRALIKVFLGKFICLGMLACFKELVIQIGQPIALGYLIRHFAKPSDYPNYFGWAMAFAVWASSIMSIFIHHPYFFGMSHLGMKIRVACCNLVFRKTTKLSQASLQKTTIGHMMGLLSSDVNKFDSSTTFIHYLWIGPVQVAITTGILWTYFGPCSLIMLGLLTPYIPFQVYLAKKIAGYRKNGTIKVEKRMRILNQLVSGIRVIKMYAWEKPFSILVNQARFDEKGSPECCDFLSFNLTVFYTSSKIIVALTLLVYVLTGEDGLKPDMVFVTLALSYNVRLVMTLFIPLALDFMAEANVSIKRVEEFLLMEEREVLKQSMDGGKTIQNIGVKVKNATAKWSLDDGENAIENISVNLENGKLIAITGHVGCGKTSVLHAILGELPVSQGTVDVRGKIAYSAQEPWLFPGSVKENILFGKAYDEDRYQKVIEACALEEDLELLPYADNSLVGDGASLLSGGQKLRVSLARATYANADIYLWDEPFAALDTHIGHKIFLKCIGPSGLLSSKARIIVSHQLEVLEQVDYIIILENGRPLAEGTFNELVSKGIDFNVASELPPPNPLKEIKPLRTHKGWLSSMTFHHGGGPTYPSPSVKHFLKDNKSIYPANKSSSHGKLARKSTLIPKRLAKDEKFQEEEEEVLKHGGVSGFIFYKFFRAGSGGCTIFFLILSSIICQICFTVSDLWLTWWTTAEVLRAKNKTIHGSRSDPWYPFYHVKAFQLYGYLVVIGLVVLTTWMRTSLFFRSCAKASGGLHKSMLEGVIRAPMQFFETNSPGRILNRFSKDMEIVDGDLPFTYFDTVGISFYVLGIMIVLAVVNPFFLIFDLVLFNAFYVIRKFYMSSARALKRLEGVARSPLFAHVRTSVSGITTIRAFNMEDDMINQFQQRQDFHSGAWFLCLAAIRWFGIVLDWVSITFLGVIIITLMLKPPDESANVGLAVSSAMMITGILQWGMRQAADTENIMVSVERVMEYAELKPEAALLSSTDKTPPADWPQKGQLSFKNVSLELGPHQVLTNISFSCQPSDKIGIVGRSGAGKSSLIAALLRLAEPTGSIIIDDVEVTQIGLHDLRSKITIIPQDPVVFEGTVRKNLDPFDQFSDDIIWDALEETHLAHHVRLSPLGLNESVSEGGVNFSIGQRQLICLARAILKNNRILLLDEATAEVDNDTDVLIQNVIRTKFNHCTILSVAHRLHTIIDSDKILVLDCGRVLEFDDPYILLQDVDGAFRSLVDETGPEVASDLIKNAKFAYDLRRGE